MGVINWRQRDALRFLAAAGALVFPTAGENATRDLCGELKELGLARRRYSSIGEVDEKVHYFVTDEGKAVARGEPR